MALALARQRLRCLTEGAGRPVSQPLCLSPSERRRRRRPPLRLYPRPPQAGAAEHLSASTPPGCGEHRPHAPSEFTLPHGCGEYRDPLPLRLVVSVEDLENKQQLPGVKMFFGYEIKNLAILDDLPAASANQQANDGNGERSKLEDATPRKVFGEQHSPEYENLEYEDLEYIIIDQFHEKFGPAIFHIKQQNVIGVALKGINICRFGKLCWIQISTKYRIYCFDIFLLGAATFRNGLKMILEDSNILKVIHNCRLVSDCLYHQYQVDLTNVFDTQVADVMQFYKETGGLLPSCVSTLEECLVRHLGLSRTKIRSLQHSACALKVNPKVWSCRPLPRHLLQSAGMEVMLLLSLRTVLMDKLMMDFTTQVDNYMSMYRNMPNISFGYAEISSLELPYELKELTVIHKLRREDALKKYRTDENGLLVRPYPHFENNPKERIINIDDIPELETTKTSRGDGIEVQNE
ncbi:piRNA biogenesis protein EXD1 isoform X1 [Amblyraja radiata]|uniref:piRNA biogenesis protein EXD1 isoform X1 n=1 Tax=Amblyraja radiata TaxID=386614 RepID=UPI001403ACD7|nr:piRNA biogenesis protein EXD1 isoform X1 [Amblyraja radiata]